MKTIRVSTLNNTQRTTRHAGSISFVIKALRKETTAAALNALLMKEAGMRNIRAKALDISL